MVDNRIICHYTHSNAKIRIDVSTVLVHVEYGNHHQFYILIFTSITGTQRNNSGMGDGERPNMLYGRVFLGVWFIDGSNVP
jgi:hypothetical protein